jgi:hypothetical protein
MDVRPMAARKILLPHFSQTLVSTGDTPHASRVDLPAYSPIPCYYFRPIFDEETNERNDGEPSWKHSQYNLYPVVLNDDGSPWAEVAVYLQARLEDTVLPSMGTYAGIAGDLGAFRRFLDSSGLDWTHFPAQKLSRATYRYNGHLLLAVEAGDTASTTAKRRMSSVVSLYRWLMAEGIFKPAHTPWKESDRFVEIKDSRGLKFVKKIKSTDVSIKIPSQKDPYAGTIDDGGRLRPLPPEEQDWLLEALTARRNTEMTLIHLFGLLTGARIQTILTFRVRDTMLEIDEMTGDDIRFPVGFGTGVDTKGDKQIVLHIPVKFYRALITYANSPRARRRRLRAKGGDHIDQYLFLSVRGAPHYRNKSDTRIFDSEATLRYEKTAQGVRQFITERIIPYVRRHHAANFDYNFHDTRATYGMNLTDFQLQRVAKGEISLLAAREFVKTMMGHDSADVTDRYLQYRGKLKFIRQVENSYDEHIWTLAERALKGQL